MKPVNFEFLRARRAALADLAGFAEGYSHEEPASSLIKQRSFVEHAVAAIYESLRPPYSDNLNDLMNEATFRQTVPEVVQNMLHAVRKAGNHAVHLRRPATSQLSLECLGQLFDIARWFNAVQNRFAWGERRFITKEKYDNLRRNTVRPRDVIVTIMGTTGRSADLPDDIRMAITTKHLATITLGREQAEPEFVSQALFRYAEAFKQITAGNRGAIMSGLKLGLSRALRIPVPPIERQREFGRVTLRGRVLTARMTTDTATEGLCNFLVTRAFSGGLRA